MLTDLQDLWITSRRGALPKANEVQTINVAKTCDRLRLAITQPRNELQRNLDITDRNEMKELTFRSVSCLCYTTLRVHEMQVNDLLSRSEMLVAQSGSWSSIKLPSKRKSSQTSGCYQIRRKRQRSIVHSTESISFTDYTQLLDETQHFVEWSKRAEVVDKRVSNITKRNVGAKTTCIHIREITINEVDTHNEHYVTDEDEGFGNATTDELNTIIRMMEESRAETKATKRKMIESNSVSEKRVKMSTVPTCENTMGIPEDSEIEVARGFDGNDNYADDRFTPAMECNSTIDERGILNAVKNDVVTGDVTYCNKNDGKPVDVNPSLIEISNQYSAGHASNPRKESKCKPKITIDERIELTAAEMRTQIKVQFNLRAKLRKRRAKIKSNGKAQCTQSAKHYGCILPSANALLSTLSRRCIPLSKFKLKKTTSNIYTMGSTDRHLLRQILDCEISDELANQIYENSNVLLKRKHQRLPSPALEKISSPPLENDCNQNPLVSNNEIENELLNNNDNLERVVENVSTTNDQDDCEAFDVMVKLLNLWRSKNVGDEICVEYILKPTAMLRQQAAKAFYALLKLASQGFVVLVRGSRSAQLKGIQLGPASAKLIQKGEVNGKTLRRRYNGYRIHAN